MKTVTVSPKCQVVIPLYMREVLCIKPGEKMQVINYADRIELVPVKKLRPCEVFLKGIDTAARREKDWL